MIRKTLVATSVLALAAFACGDGGGDTTTTAATATTTTTTAATTTSAAVTTTAGATGDVHTVVVQNFRFEPADLEIAAGDAVRFSWESGTHTSTEGSGAWASGAMSSGSSFTVILDEPGTYSYFCEFHPSMQGTVTVTG